MFEGEDQQALQTLIKYSTIMPDNQKTPNQLINAISMTIKAEGHFWHFWDEFLLDVTQLPDEGIHALSTRTSLINNCKFLHQHTKGSPKDNASTACGEVPPNP